jgi:hypothetical protein
MSKIWLRRFPTTCVFPLITLIWAGTSSQVNQWGTCTERHSSWGAAALSLTSGMALIASLKSLMALPWPPISPCKVFCKPSRNQHSCIHPTQSSYPSKCTAKAPSRRSVRPSSTISWGQSTSITYQVTWPILMTSRICPFTLHWMSWRTSSSSNVRRSGSFLSCSLRHSGLSTHR